MAVEVLSSRYPHICKKVFSLLDAKSLVNCRIVCKEWRDLIQEQDSLWLQMIKKYIVTVEYEDIRSDYMCGRGRQTQYGKSWFKMIRNSPIPILRDFAKILWESLDNSNTKENKNKDMGSDIHDHWRIQVQQRLSSPLHVLAWKGNLEIFLHLSNTLNDKNPMDHHGYTPLHFAANMNNFEVCQAIIENDDVIDKNPENYDRLTPLHLAAEGGYLQICELIISKTEDKNPMQDGFPAWTPLHFAANNAHLEVCQLIIANVDDKNPNANWAGEASPYHLAAEKGHVEVCKLFLETLTDKNPMDVPPKRGTPLHLAIENGHFEICQMIISQTTNKCPSLNGKTPLHVAAECSDDSIFKLIFEYVEEKNPKQRDEYPYYTPLYIAATNGNISMCKMIMENIDEKYPLDQFNYDRNGKVQSMAYTILQQNIIQNDIEAFEYLLDILEDKNPENPATGNNILCMAAIKGHVEIVKLILEKTKEEITGKIKQHFDRAFAIAVRSR